MLCRVLQARMGALNHDIASLYALAGDTAIPLTIRLAATGSLATFLSSPDQPLEKWLLDTLTLRMGLCLVMSALGREHSELADDVRLVKRSLSANSIRRIEATLTRLVSSEFAGGGLTSVVNDPAVLARLYRQALDKAERSPSSVPCDEVLLRTKLESLLGGVVV